MREQHDSGVPENEWDGRGVPCCGSHNKVCGTRKKDFRVGRKDTKTEGKAGGTASKEARSEASHRLFLLTASLHCCYSFPLCLAWSEPQKFMNLYVL